MPVFFRKLFDLVRRVFIFARPYGLKKLVAVLLVSLAQGLFQVLGVSSIFPFLAVAADPNQIRSSEVGAKILGLLPPLDNGQLLLWTGVLAIGMLFLSNSVNFGSDIYRSHYSRQFGHWLRVGILK